MRFPGVFSVNDPGLGCISRSGPPPLVQVCRRVDEGQEVQGDRCPPVGAQVLDVGARRAEELAHVRRLGGHCQELDVQGEASVQRATAERL